MLMPKKVKYRKQQRGRRRGKAWRGSTLEFGDYGLKVLDAGWITDRQIEAGRIAITRFVKRGGKIWIRVFPDLSLIHISEPTRLLSISYAVFCLKKKKLVWRSRCP